MTRFARACAFFALSVFFASACASTGQRGPAPDSVRVGSYKAHSFVYSTTASPSVYETSFKSRYTITEKADIVSYRIENFFASDSQQADRDNVAILAISGASAGFGLYDLDNKPLVEYPKGSYGGSAARFERQAVNGRQVVIWLFSRSRSLMSIIQSFDSSGEIVYAEYTTYRPQ